MTGTEPHAWETGLMDTISYIGLDVDKATILVALAEGGRGFGRGEAGGDAVPLQAAVDGAARQRGIEAAPHRLGDVVERQGEAAAQLDDQGFFPIRHHRGQPMRTGRAVEELGARLPPRHGPAVDAELAGQRAGRGAALLDIGAGARRRGAIGVQLEIHQPALPWLGLQHPGCLPETLAPVGPQEPPTRRAARLAGVAPRARGSLLWTTGTSCASSRSSRRCCTISRACHNRAPSRQSSGTEHAGRGRLWCAPGRRRAGCCPFEFGDGRAAGLAGIGQPCCGRPTVSRIARTF